MAIEPLGLLKWLGSGLVLAIFLIVFLGLTYEQIGRGKDRAMLPQRVGRAIDIGGRSINLYCTGSGSPAVIMETGGSAAGYAWVLVQPRIAAFTQACWYDRAGQGWSGAPPAPETAAMGVNDLHEALPPRVLQQKAARLCRKRARAIQNLTPLQGTLVTLEIAL